MNDPAPSPKLLTVGQALKKATAYLQSKGRESSRLSAELLLAHVLATNRLGVYLRAEAPLEKGEIEQMRGLLARRGQGEPVAYILGEKEFMGLSFEVAPTVLIPRPDTELLVEKVSAAIGPDGEARIVDVGAGSGNILISILHRCPRAVGIAVDLSARALELVQRNALKHGVEQRLTCVEGSLFSGLGEQDRATFDWIVSNPPYICDDEWPHLAVEIRQFEPREALLAGPDGLAVYRPLVAEAPPWLKPGGEIALEIGPRVHEGVLNLVQASGFEQVETFEDLGGHSRLILARARASIDSA